MLRSSKSLSGFVGRSCCETRKFDLFRRISSDIYILASWPWRLQAAAFQYSVIHKDAFCEDGTLYDNNPDDGGDGKSYATLDACQDLCDSQPSCKFIVFGWGTHDGGFNRCATFATCDSWHTYKEGDPDVYMKQACHVAPVSVTCHLP